MLVGVVCGLLEVQGAARVPTDRCGRRLTTIRSPAIYRGLRRASPRGSGFPPQRPLLGQKETDIEPEEYQEEQLK